MFLRLVTADVGLLLQGDLALKNLRELLGLHLSYCTSFELLLCWEIHCVTVASIFTETMSAADPSKYKMVVVGGELIVRKCCGINISPNS